MNKTNQFTAQYSMFEPVQLGLDLRTSEQKAQAEQITCTTRYTSACQDRGMSEIISSLSAIAHECEVPGHPQYKRGVMADAIAWGLSTARTTHRLERYLFGVIYDLDEVLDCLTAGWDGADFLNGALHSANHNPMTALLTEE